MPLVRISLRSGKPPAYKRALADGVYSALTDAFDVPPEDRFILVHEHDVAGFHYSPSYMDVARSDDVVFFQIACSNTRSLETKKRFFKRLVDVLVERPGLRPEDVFINLVEVGGMENWSFGHGVAQYVEKG
ncbi:MAG: tautomerase family protein [Rhodospirillaceae bacterium]|nr:tautomerase family protein [Rhodospirillaceae bacterium]